MKDKEKMDRGEHRFQTKGQLAAIKWQDRKLVTVLSTGFNPSSVVKINRRNKDGTKSDVSCPTAIARYDKVMRGVDHLDHSTQKRKDPPVSFLAHKMRVPDDGSDFQALTAVQLMSRGHGAYALHVMYLCAWNHASANST